MRFGGREASELRIIRRVQTIRVAAGNSHYPIEIGPGLLHNRDLLAARIPGTDLLIVSNLTVAPLYLERLRASLPGRRVGVCVLPDGEQHKTLATAAGIFDELVAQQFNRDATLIALGGGVVGDIGGFAAACYQRGIACVQIPTTLLAQVDSSVGGKTGVNHPGGKNLIGAFHQPAAVIADTDTLATLPERELRAGIAEVIKYGCIYDPLLFAWLEKNLPQILAREPQALIHAVARACEIKAAVVARDERESSIRAILNFGHTFGHAIEAATAYQRYLHGEAVALGMLIAADCSRRLGMIDADVVERIRTLLAQAGLPTEAPRIGVDRAKALMRMDKKVQAGVVRLVLLAGLGRAVFSGGYAPDALDATLTEYFA